MSDSELELLATKTMAELLKKDFEAIENKKLKMMGVFGDESSPSFTYSYTGTVVSGFEVTVVGTRDDIADYLISAFYDLPQVKDTKDSQELLKLLTEFIGQNGPVMEVSDKGKTVDVPVSFTVERVDAFKDANEYALRRKHLQFVFIEFAKIDNLSVPTFRVTFKE